MLPKASAMNQKEPTQGITKQEKTINNENIDPIRARQLSHKKIKSYSLENKIKIILFNSKF